jgi:hypothetical protein
VWTAGLALICALGAAGLRDEPGQALVAFSAPDVTMPTDDSALLALMASHDVKDAYAPYWIAHRVMFETGARTEVAPYDYDRYPPNQAAVGASPDPAYLFVTASKTLGSFETWCREHHIGYQAWHLGSFTVVQPARKVDPSALPRTVLSRDAVRLAAVLTCSVGHRTCSCWYDGPSTMLGRQPPAAAWPMRRGRHVA